VTRFVRQVMIAGAALGLALSASGEVRGRVRAVHLVRVKADSVTLADFLPAGTPQGVRSRAARIVLGAAPLAGSPRRFSREEIERRLGPELAGEIEIPASVVVERRARELSREEVFGAIRAALGKKGFANAAGLHLADVELGMPVMVTEADPGLRVLGMRFDPVLQLAIFRLWTANEHEIRPFDVIVRPVDGLGAWLDTADGGARRMQARARIAERAARMARRMWRPRGKPLVMALRMASLVLVSGTMEIHTTAEALEPGYLGQVIRVRMTNTRQVMRAKVVGTDYLEAGF
jgi:Chaperone for flagella basal body P-ring formation